MLFVVISPKPDSRKVRPNVNNKHQKEINEFPFMFAFNQKQFDEGMKKFGLEPTDTDKICRVMNGGFIRKTDKNALVEMLSRHSKEMEDAIAEDEDGTGFILDMFVYELANHEYSYTGDLEPTLDCLELTIEEVQSDERLLNGLKLAIKKLQSEEESW